MIHLNTYLWSKKHWSEFDLMSCIKSNTTSPASVVPCCCEVDQIDVVPFLTVQSVHVFVVHVSCGDVSCCLSILQGRQVLQGATYDFLMSSPKEEPADWMITCLCVCCEHEYTVRSLLSSCSTTFLTPRQPSCGLFQSHQESQRSTDLKCVRPQSCTKLL